MDAKTVIDTLLEQEETTRYRLAKRLRVHESLLSRAYNYKSDPGFNEVSRWLETLGYTLEITVNPNKPLADAHVFDINNLGRKLNTYNTDTYDYLELHRLLKQVLESQSLASAPPEILFYPSSVNSKAWRAFYAATIAYLYKVAGEQTPRCASINANKTETPWSPIQKLSKSHTDFDETYLEYNVLIPQGELTWI
ncbi:MAG: hypothetical protein FWF91_07110 [Coriobacteriia bacterium]|nr:hypothetical protein [Coriobacteriia bacterium]